MDITPDDLEVINNHADGQFEITVDGLTAFLAYERADGMILYPHTVVPPRLERHGLAARLSRHALDYARSDGLRVVPACPYVAAYIREHPEYEDLVAVASDDA